MVGSVWRVGFVVGLWRVGTAHLHEWAPCLMHARVHTSPATQASAHHRSVSTQTTHQSEQDFGFLWSCRGGEGQSGFDGRLGVQDCAQKERCSKASRGTTQLGGEEALGVALPNPCCNPSTQQQVELKVFVEEVNTNGFLVGDDELFKVWRGLSLHTWVLMRH